MSDGILLMIAKKLDGINAFEGILGLGLPSYITEHEIKNRAKEEQEWPEL